jgi:hypothetical protein
MRAIPSLLLLICSHLALAAAEATSWQHQEGTEIQYLTIADGTACIQTADGSGVWAVRLVSEAGKVVCYRMGKPAGQQLVQTPTEVTVVDHEHPGIVFTPCPTPPESIGWQPYALPPTVADPAKRKQIADELVKRFATEQELRHDAIQQAHGQMDQQTMQQPEVQAKWQLVNRTDEDNRLWVETTLRRDGWIGRKTHGDKATEALLLIGLHNVSHLRLAATLQAQWQAEWKRGELNEMAFANISDRLALMLAGTMSYGIQATVDASGQPVVPVIADGDKLDANRKRIGQPPMASAAASMGAKVLRIGDDGRLVGEGAANAKGLDTLDQRHAMRDPAWGLTAAGQADAALGAAIAAAKAGDAGPLTAWTKQANSAQRNLVGQLLMGQGQGPGQDSDIVVVSLRPLFDGMIAGTPPAEDLRLLLSNTLAYGLVARPTAPTAEELARAVALAEPLEAAVRRPEIIANSLGHCIADTIACIRFRQGDRAKAATWWHQALTWAGAQAPELYRKRLAIAEGADAADILPR